MCVLVSVLGWVAFGGLFFLISKKCGLDRKTFLMAMYLSIETVETIGYGVPDQAFTHCGEGLMVIGAAALWSTMLSTVMIAVIYTKISRATSRATSVCFSEKAVITGINGVYYLMFQVCDFRKHQLCEAHVRLYSIRHEDMEGVGVGRVCFQTRSMRLQHPDDELGGMLLPALPQLVVHRIDAWSP